MDFKVLVLVLFRLSQFRAEHCTGETRADADS